MSYLYGGTILRVNLGEGKISKEPTSPYAERLLGGRGVNIRLLFDGASPEVAPLEPSSPLIFGVGPLTGTPVPASRVEVTGRSPETGFLGSSSFGGSFGPELKYAGYDHVVVTGKADQPVYLWINNDEVEIRDASYLWGKDSYQTQDLLRTQVGPESKIACIGQAGENLVHFASVQHDLGRAAGRTGMGAVMGSKNLKAVAVRGTREIELADPDRYLAIAEDLQRELRNRPEVQDIQRHGMANGMDAKRALSWDPDWKPVRTAEIVDQYHPKRTGCLGCPQQCKDLYPVGSRGGGGVISCVFYSAPFFPVRNTNHDLALECGVLAQRYGVDIISTMMIIAWLMELHENGIITAQDTDGIPMEWGSPQAIKGMLNKIVRREGIGDLLADGLLPAAEEIGRGAREFADQVIGLSQDSSVTGYRAIPNKGYSLARVMARGDGLSSTIIVESAQVFKRLQSDPDQKRAAEQAAAYRRRYREIAGTEKAAMNDEYEGKPELVIYIEDGITVDDCLGFCHFLGGSNYSFPVRVKQQPVLLTAGLGVPFSEEELFVFAKRVKTLERAYDVRLGRTRENDKLPKRWMDRPIERGDFKGSVLETRRFEEMKTKYYLLRGWDPAAGIPTRDLLKQNGLEDVADDLQRRGKLPVEPSPTE